MTFTYLKRLIALLFLGVSLGLAGCSSDSSPAATSTAAVSVSALPQPNVNCSGNSCID